jgi:hypothetical protein
VLFGAGRLDQSAASRPPDGATPAASTNSPQEIDDFRVEFPPLPSFLHGISEPVSCQIAMALRPRRSASMISSRYGSQALALGARPGRGTGAGSVDTSVLVAGFAPPESVDTSAEMAGFAGQGRSTPAVGNLPVLPSIRSGGRGHARGSPHLSDSC